VTGERRSPGGQGQGEGDTMGRSSRTNIPPRLPSVNCIDSRPDLDFPIAGPDPLQALFEADAADLGDAFKESALLRAVSIPPAEAPPSSPPTRHPCPANRPTPAAPAPVKRLVRECEL